MVWSLRCVCNNFDTENKGKTFTADLNVYLFTNL